jgi:hypothetical protein
MNAGRPEKGPEKGPEKVSGTFASLQRFLEPLLARLEPLLARNREMGFLIVLLAFAASSWLIFATFARLRWLRSRWPWWVVFAILLSLKAGKGVRNLSAVPRSNDEGLRLLGVTQTEGINPSARQNALSRRDLDVLILLGIRLGEIAAEVDAAAFLAGQG